MRIISLSLILTLSLLGDDVYFDKNSSTIKVDINNNAEVNTTRDGIKTMYADINETNKSVQMTNPSFVENESNETQEILFLKDDKLFKSNRESGFSLANSITYSLDKNPKIKASAQKVLQSVQKVKEESASHLPVIDLSGNTGQEARTFKEDYSSGVKVLAPQTQFYQYHKTELFLSIKENLWSGGKIQNRVNEQENRLQAARYDHREKIETAALDIIKSYFDVVYGEIAVNISNKNMADYQKILTIVKIKEQSGAATLGDVNFILANITNAKTAHVNTQAKLSDSIAQYEYLMQDVNTSNMPYETDVIIQETNLEEALAYMEKNNAKLLRQKSYIQATSFSLKAQEASYHPTVDLSLNAESKNEYDEGLGQRDKVNALISFNYNLYNGGKDEAAYIRILSTMNEQKYTYDDQMRKLVFDIKVLNRSVVSLGDALRLIESEVIASRKVVKNYWIAFKHGTQDLQALQLAQRNVNRAELDYANYKKDLILNNFRLMKNTGMLLKFLNIVNED